MSFVSVLGGVDASVFANQINDILEKLNKISLKLADLESRACNIELDLENTQINEAGKISEIEKKISANEIRCAELKNKYSTDGLMKRVDDLDRLNRYFQSSHGKVLNDIQDMKKELYELYGRMCPPSETELKKSVERNPEALELEDAINASDFKENRKPMLIEACRKNGIDSFEKLGRMSFADLCAVNGIGPASAELLQKLYEKYTGKDLQTHSIRNDIQDLTIREVMKDMTIYPVKNRTRFTNAMQHCGISTVRELSEFTPEEILKVRNIGRAFVPMVNDIYKTYIWAQE